MHSLRPATRLPFGTRPRQGAHAFSFPAPGARLGRTLAFPKCPAHVAGSSLTGLRRVAVLAASGPAETERSEAEWRREEERWQREEARWEREEERWHREEARWMREREQLRQQIRGLREALTAALAKSAHLTAGGEAAIDVEVQLGSLSLSALDAIFPVDGAVAKPVFSAPAPAPPKDPALPRVPAASGPEAQSILASTAPSTAAPPLPPALPPTTPAASPVATPRRTLRVGSEGLDVQELQHLLSLQGFYCGDEDTEYAMFSESTESAVKTWQATIGVKEDGIVTPVLMAVLSGEAEPSVHTHPAPQPPPTLTPASSSLPPNPHAATRTPTAAPNASSEAGPTSSRRPAPTRDTPEIERYARSGIEVGERRVFLLGENRWEDPSRLTTSARPTLSAGAASAPTALNGVVSVGAVRSAAGGGGGGGLRLGVPSKCFECRGEGRIVCIECEGTGDLNVEEQFLDWASDDPKCLYCDGIGAVVCDVCDGSGVTEDTAK